MRILIVLSSILLLHSCSNPNENSDVIDDEVFTLCEEPTLDADTSSFQYFVGRFPELVGTYEQKPHDLWSGDHFFNEDHQEYDYESTSIPYYLVEKWLMKDSIASDLGREVTDAGLLLQEAGDRWYMVHYGIRISTQKHNYLLVHYYEKTSEINGAYWTSYWLDFDKYGDLLECLKLGQEGLYSSSMMIDTEEESYWARHTSIKDMEITITSEKDIKVCISSRMEVEGDLTNEELEKVNGTTVVNDSLMYTEYYPDECVEY